MEIAEKLEQFKDEISKVIMGQEDVMELIFISLTQRGHILFESVPGTGKTLLSKSVSKAIDGRFSRIQFTPDVMPSDITGLNIYNPKTHDFELQMGPVDTNILLADEINRATPRTQSALLEVMEEKQITIDGETLILNEPFLVLATQNPIESKQGTFDLPEAQMDRFFMKIDLNYPSKENELMMMDIHKNSQILNQIQAVFSQEDIIEIQQLSEHVEVNEIVKSYILDIIHQTRHHELVHLGVSPRGTLALMRAGIGSALINGRNYVTPGDIKYTAPYVLSHRLILNIEGMTLKSPEDIIVDILNQTEVPVEYGVSRDEI
jgi:MoxR-like ATPase